jgi:hypothetical protein
MVVHRKNANLRCLVTHWSRLCSGWLPAVANPSEKCASYEGVSGLGWGCEAARRVRTLTMLYTRMGLSEYGKRECCDFQ